MGDYIYDCDYCGYSETSESPDIEGHLRTAHGITDYQEIKQARNDLQRDESTFDPYEEQMIFGEEAPMVDAPRGPDPNFPYGLSLDPIADYDRFAGKLSQPTTQDSMDDLDLHDELWGNDNTGSAFDNLTKFPLGGETKADELSPEAQCPNCGSYKTILEGKSSLGYGKRKQYVCQNCYNVFQSEYTPKQIRGFNESVASEFEFGGYSIKCDRCDGTGFTNQEIEFGGALECPDCNGTGKIEMTSSIPDSLSESKSNELNKTQFVKDFFDLDKAHLDIHGLLELQKNNESKATEAYRDCYNCDGEGYINDSECPMCSGSGLIKKYDWEDVPDADTNFLPPEIVYGESEATEGGLGSGRGGHEPWMKEITELKANKHSIPSKNMTSNRFLKELASEDYGGLSGLRGITFKECPT